jgi:hypothetical protein
MTETRGLRFRTSLAVEDDVADLKVVKILEQRLWHRTSGTSAYSHTFGDHDDSRNPVSSRDAEVDGFGTEIWKLCNTTACRGCDSRLLRSSLGGQAGERERER